MTVKKKKLRCYIYTRVSTQMQVEGYSLDAQRERLLKEAAHREMTVAAEFSDEGKSGKNTTGRPEFTEMMNRIQHGNPDKIDYVLVFKLSRFGRNTADVLNNLQVMEDYGVSLLAVEDGIDSAGAAGKLMIAVLAAVAEIERENIRTQSQAGRKQKAREGGWNGGPAPLGYRIENGRLVVDEDEARLVRLVFEKYARTNMGYSGVAKWLNANGYRRNVRQNGKYPVFTDFAVKSILDNPVYIGKVVYGRYRMEKVQGRRNESRRVKQDQYETYDGGHEALVSDELWEEVRAKRAAAAGRPQGHYGPKHIHVLSGLVICPECGQPMYGNVSQVKKKDESGKYPPKFYYVCKNSRRANGTDCTYRRSIREEPLDRQVLAVAQQAMDNMYIQKGLIASLRDTDNLDELAANLDRLNAARKKAEQKKSRLLGKIANLDVDDAQYDAMYDDLQGVLRQHNQAIAELDDQIAETSSRLRAARDGAASFEETLRMFHRSMGSIGSWPPEQLRAFLHNFIERIEIYPQTLPGGRMVRRIRFKFPVSVDGGLTYSEVVDLDDDDDTPPEGGPPDGGGHPLPPIAPYDDDGDFPIGDVLPLDDGILQTSEVLPNPNTVERVFTSTPFCRARTENVCLRSWKRIRSSPARFKTLWSIWRTLSGDMEPPNGDGKTYSSFCSMPLRTSTASAPIAILR